MKLAWPAAHAILTPQQAEATHLEGWTSSHRNHMNHTLKYWRKQMNSDKEDFLLPRVRLHLLKKARETISSQY